MSNAYFGECWNPHVAKSHEKTPAPVGEPFSYCDELIKEGEQGFVVPHVGSSEDHSFRPVHLDCFLRQIYGSLGHLQKKCSCYGGNEEDPPGMTKRQAAVAAVVFYESSMRSERLK
jgi:hypothetical protein